MTNYIFGDFDVMCCKNCYKSENIVVSKLWTGGLLVRCSNCNIKLARANTWEDLE